MKKISLLLLLIGVSVFSQNEIYLGINTGLTHSNFRGNHFFDNYDSQLDFLIGGSFELGIKENLFISTDINYERNSIKFYYEQYVNSDGSLVVVGSPWGEDPISDPKFKFQTRFEYLTMPIMIKYLFGNRKNLFLNAGAHISYLLNIKNINNGEESDLDFNNGFKKTSFGITAGFGYNFEVNSKNQLSIELRDNFGITNINKNDSGQFNNTKKNSVNLILSWNFKI